MSKTNRKRKASSCSTDSNVGASSSQQTSDKIVQSADGIQSTHSDVGKQALSGHTNICLRENVALTGHLPRREDRKIVWVKSSDSKSTMLSMSATADYDDLVQAALHSAKLNVSPGNVSLYHFDGSDDLDRGDIIDSGSTELKPFIYDVQQEFPVLSKHTLVGCMDQVYLLGNDDKDVHGNAFLYPNCTAIALGPRLLLSCTHSLVELSSATEHRMFQDDYWVTKAMEVKNFKFHFQSERIPVKLLQYNLQDDWALFRRIDGQDFPSYSEIDSIENYDGEDSLVSRRFALFYYPVEHCINELHKGRAIQMSTHHFQSYVQTQEKCYVTYHNNGCLSRGASGGPLLLFGCRKVLGWHCDQRLDQRDIGSLKDGSDSDKLEASMNQGIVPEWSMSRIISRYPQLTECIKQYNSE